MQAFLPDFTGQFLSNPDINFYWLDIVLSACIYVFSLALFLKHKKAYIIPLLIFGLFVLPLQFSMWFLREELNFITQININFFRFIYLFFVKLCLILTIVFSKQ
jgi:hypothetical protein